MEDSWEKKKIGKSELWYIKVIIMSYKTMRSKVLIIILRIIMIKIHYDKMCQILSHFYNTDPT